MGHGKGQRAGRAPEVENGRVRPNRALLIAPAVAVLLVAFFYPSAEMFRRSVFDPDFTLANFRTVFGHDLYLRTFVRTFRLSATVALLALVMGFPVAWLMSRVRGFWAAVIAGCVIFPLWTSVLVRSFSWTILLSRNGIINETLIGLGIIDAPLRLLYTDLAVVVAMTHVMLPFMILPIYSVLKDVPVELMQAARGSGASDFAAFRTVLLPLALPGIAAGLTIVFLVSLGFFVTPMLVGGSRSLMIATLIAQEVTQNYNWGLAAALSLTLLAAALVFVLLLGRFMRIGAR